MRGWLNDLIPSVHRKGYRLMFTIRVDHDLDKIAKQFGMLAQGHVPAAAARAINVTARMTKDSEENTMRGVFDRPTPWAMNSVFIKAATERDPSARVWLKDDRATSGGGIPATKFLAAEIRGGGRALKAFEVRLRNRGILPEGYRTVPGSGASIDQYGNMSRGQIIQMLSYFETANIHGDYSNMSDKNRAAFGRRQAKKIGTQNVQCFVGRPGDGRLPFGIWQRAHWSRGATSIKPILLFVSHAVYKAIFNFEDIANKVVERNLPGLFKQAMESELEQAR
jgi:hypothetical protein